MAFLCILLLFLIFVITKSCVFPGNKRLELPGYVWLLLTLVMTVDFVNILTCIVAIIALVLSITDWEDVIENAEIKLTNFLKNKL